MNKQLSYYFSKCAISRKIILFFYNDIFCICDYICDYIFLCICYILLYLFSNFLVLFSINIFLKLRTILFKWFYFDPWRNYIICCCLFLVIKFSNQGIGLLITHGKMRQQKRHEKIRPQNKHGKWNNKTDIGRILHNSCLKWLSKLPCL